MYVMYYIMYALHTGGSLVPMAFLPRSIYIYGEAWDFGEMVDNARGVNCGQLNLGGAHRVLPHELSHPPFPHPCLRSCPPPILVPQAPASARSTTGSATRRSEGGPSPLTITR